jgi:serine phosphatase RsbU (regulator of sigma subunit)
VTAGLIMMMVQTSVRTAIQRAAGAAPSRVLSDVNAAVRNNLRLIGDDQYMTLTALQLEGSRVRYAGLHQDILVYRAATRAVDRVATRGVWIGMLDSVDGLLEDDTLDLADGDVLLLYTDGMTERVVGPGRLGTDGLRASFLRIATETADVAAIVKGVMSEFEGCASNDDVTVMAVRYAPARP